MIGVPVLNEEMSCPPNLLTPYVQCTAPKVQGKKGEKLLISIKKCWGYDISGRVEADMITSLFAELSMTIPKISAKIPLATPTPVA